MGHSELFGIFFVIMLEDSITAFLCVVFDTWVISPFPSRETLPSCYIYIIYRAQALHSPLPNLLFSHRALFCLMLMIYGHFGTLVKKKKASRTDKHFDWVQSFLRAEVETRRSVVGKIKTPSQPAGKVK